MPEVVNVQFRGKGKAYFFDPAGTEPQAGDAVIVETAKGTEYGECVQEKHMVEDENIVPPLRPVLRVATEEDRKLCEANREKEQKAFAVCQKKIEEHGLEMKLVDVEYSFDNSKILFFFTSDGRVDFRELVKDLAGVFHTRIELRQIGVRDSAKLVGGLGICGRPFCCSAFLDDFQPVSIKMAKTQSLSLNPAKISGTCGRLMCCLKYEQEAYEDLIKKTPKIDSEVDTPQGKGTIKEINLLRRTVKVKLTGSTGDVKSYPLRELGYTVGGEYKAPQPPEEKPVEEEPKESMYLFHKTAHEVSAPPQLSTAPEVRPATPPESTAAAGDEKAPEVPTAEEKNTRPASGGGRRRSNHHRRGGKKPEGAQNTQSTQNAQGTQNTQNTQSAQSTPDKRPAAPAAEGKERQEGAKPYRAQNNRPRSGGERRPGTPPAQKSSQKPAQNEEKPPRQNNGNNNGNGSRGNNRSRPPRPANKPHEDKLMDSKARARAAAVAEAVAQAKPKHRRRPLKSGGHRDEGVKKPEGNE